MVRQQRRHYLKGREIKKNTNFPALWLVVRTHNQKDQNSKVRILDIYAKGMGGLIFYMHGVSYVFVWVGKKRGGGVILYFNDYL